MCKIWKGLLSCWWVTKLWTWLLLFDVRSWLCYKPFVYLWTMPGEMNIVFSTFFNLRCMHGYMRDTRIHKYTSWWINEWIKICDYQPWLVFPPQGWSPSWSVARQWTPCQGRWVPWLALDSTRSRAWWCQWRRRPALTENPNLRPVPWACWRRRSWPGEATGDGRDRERQRCV